MKKEYNYLTFDTETCGSFSEPLVYDLGGMVHNRKGTPKLKFSFVIDEVFYGMEEKMKSAYYSSKIPKYREDIENGVREVVPLSYAKEYIESICVEYKVKACIAHNARFDYKSTKYTAKAILNLEALLPQDIELWDTLKMAKQVIAPMKKYQDFCRENGFMTKHKTPRPQLTAEVLYRFFTNDLDFIESHTALEDVQIEVLIFVECMKKHKPMVKALFE